MEIYPKEIIMKTKIYIKGVLLVLCIIEKLKYAKWPIIVGKFFMCIW